MSPPWMPLYIADYRADTAHLSGTEHGAYLLLIMHYWSTGAIPDDDRQLARIACLTPAEWRRVRPVVQPFFHDSWRHKRIDAELAHASDVIGKRRAAVAAREIKRATGDQSRDGSNDASRDDIRARASPSQPPSKTEAKASEERASAPRAKATRVLVDWKPSDEDEKYAVAHGLTPRQISLEAEKFRNYWTAKSGKDATKADWPATWRNWILNAVERTGKGRENGTSEPNGLVAAGQRRLAQIAELRASEHQSGPSGGGLFGGDQDVRLLPPGGRGTS